MSASKKLFHGAAPVALTLAIVCALGACKKDDAAATGPAVPVSYTHLDVYKRQAQA